MALPLQLLERLPIRKGGGEVGVRSADSLEASQEALKEAKSGLATFEALDAVLPEGGLYRGGVVELAASEGLSYANSIALAACRSAQREGLQRVGSPSFCAYVDPSQSLYGPGVEEAGVHLQRLLVVRPPLEAVPRVSLRLAKSRLFAVLVVDLAQVFSEPRFALGPWVRTVRQLAVALEGTASTVILLTDLRDHRPLPLPVAQRIELSRLDPKCLQVTVKKDPRGRVSLPRVVQLFSTNPRQEQSSEGVQILQRKNHAFS